VLPADPGPPLNFSAFSGIGGAQAPLVSGSLAVATGNFGGMAPHWVARPPYPLSLAGVTLSLSGKLLPLVFVSSTKIVFQVPWIIASYGPANETLTANYNWTTTTTPNVNVVRDSPALFSTNGLGTGQGTILNSANQLVDATHPAVAGQTQITIYCSGLGPVLGVAPIDGTAAPGPPGLSTMVTPSVSIGGVTASGVQAQLTPGSVGVYQVTATVPGGVAAGSAVEVQMTQDSVVWSNKVTIAVAK
jgi:uncharacterized protein (TIGR03437 family)